MPASRSTASHASVVFLRIEDFAEQLIAEQARLKGWLEEKVAAALQLLAPNERIVLDAPAGLAVVVLADPQGALRFAWRLAAEREIEFSVGLAHGPVRIAPGTIQVMYGDALIAAEAVARATGPGGVSASREFRDALARSQPGMRRLMAPSGSAIDAHDRAREMFSADERVVESRRRIFLGVAAVVATFILAGGVTIRLNRKPPPPPPKPVPPPEPALGAVTFDVKPEGEVYVDGVLKGTSPPLTRIQLPAGKHVVEIRRGDLKPMTVDLAIGPGEELAVSHTFVVPPPPKPSPPKSQPAKPRPQPRPHQKQQQQEEKSWWQRFLDSFKQQ